MCSCWPRRRESLLMPDVSLPFGRRVASSKCERAFRFVSAGNAESRRRLFHVLFLDFHRFERHIRRWTWWRAGNPRTELAKCAKQAEKFGKCTGRKITCLFRRGAAASLVANDPLPRKPSGSGMSRGCSAPEPPAFLPSLPDADLCSGRSLAGPSPPRLIPQQQPTMADSRWEIYHAYRVA